MKIKLSKSQWEMMGKKAGWMDDTTELDSVNDIMDAAINNPNMFKEILRNNPEISESLSTVIKSKQGGYSKVSDEEDIIRKRVKKSLGE
jgi:hypothetical protein